MYLCGKSNRLTSKEKLTRFRCDCTRTPLTITRGKRHYATSEMKATYGLSGSDGFSVDCTRCEYLEDPPSGQPIRNPNDRRTTVVEPAGVFSNQNVNRNPRSWPSVQKGKRGSNKEQNHKQARWTRNPTIKRLHQYETGINETGNGVGQWIPSNFYVLGKQQQGTRSRACKQCCRAEVITNDSWRDAILQVIFII